MRASLPLLALVLGLLPAALAQPPAADPPPVAAFEVVVENLTVVANGSATYDPDGGDVAGFYDWGDGQASTAGGPSHLDGGFITGLRATHTYGAAGNYTITLHAQDDEGSNATATRVVHVEPPPGDAAPVAAFTVDVAGLRVDADASATRDGDLAWVSWLWGDGNGTSLGGARRATHVYAAAGAYEIRLTVTDKVGQTGTATRNVTVAPRPPAPVFTLRASGLLVTADAFGTTGDAEIVAYAWDWGDGASGAGQRATHAYATGGPHRVTLRVTDSLGATNATTREIDLVVPATASPLPDPPSLERRTPGPGLAALLAAFTLARGRSGRS